MKELLLAACMTMLFASGCTNKLSKTISGKDTIYVHDTIICMPNGDFTLNLPCKVVNIHQEKVGKSILFLYLHGGVHDRAKHDFFAFNHLQCCDAEDNVIKYLEGEGIKAIVLMPVCYKASLEHCIAWKDCYDDVMSIINDYVSKGLVDPSRMYISGASDGGTGTWDYIESHADIFAAALPLSCGNPRKVTSLPIYFFNTRSERDYTKQVEALNKQGCNIQYRHCTEYKHGGDGAECNKTLLDKFFSHTR